MELKGHRSAVMWLAFSADAKRVVTVSKDKSMRVWNIDVRYHLNEVGGGEAGASRDKQDQVWGKDPYIIELKGTRFYLLQPLSDDVPRKRKNCTSSTLYCAI